VQSVWGFCKCGHPSPQPAASLSLNTQRGHGKCLLGRDLRIVSRTRIGKKKPSSGFNTGRFVQPKHRSAVCLATCVKLLEQIIQKPQVMKFQLYSKCWTPNLFFYLHKSTSDKRNTRERTRMGPTEIRLKSTTKSEAWAWPALWAINVRPALPRQGRTSVYPVTRSKVSWQLQQQARMLETDVRSTHFSDHYAM